MSAVNFVLKEIASDMETILNKCGIMYHVFIGQNPHNQLRTNLIKKKNLIELKGRKCKIY